MSVYITSGYWKPKDGQEDEFIAAWTEFAAWASEHDGAHLLRLARDLDNPGFFVSFGTWDSLEQIHAWKHSAGFAERMPKVQQHVDLFKPGELEEAVAVEAGAPAS